MWCSVLYVVSPTRGTLTLGDGLRFKKKKKDLNKIEILDVQMPSRKALLAIIKSNLKNVWKLKWNHRQTRQYTVKHVNTTKIINKS